MTAEQVLDEVLKAGGSIVPDDPPRLVVPSALKPLVIEHRAAIRALITRRVEATGATAPSPLPAARAASAWPDDLPGLGPRQATALDLCARCGTATTFATYGGYRACLPCAQWLAQAPLAAYVAILRRLWPLHTSADLVAIQEALHERTRMAEALGDDLAALVERAEGQRWYAETGLCPTCGELGEFHEPEDV
jgi:hypothetical protein